MTIVLEQILYRIQEAAHKRHRELGGVLRFWEARREAARIASLFIPETYEERIALYDQLESGYSKSSGMMSMMPSIQTMLWAVFYGEALLHIGITGDDAP